ncbi:DUF5719 family protein [Actinomyces bowdenii]|uniref:Prevent-host-death protein n=1 Tax=Actinomyces bowdenii TaxID=131109 RepID=A0A3P1URI1_9ACTO|nr:DUF5719 family protein [Actinomyces bowdenii]RRD24442.1 hypothetical protein EII10_11310 [Actinomyces bowdenii]
MSRTPGQGPDEDSARPQDAKEAQEIRTVGPEAPPAEGASQGPSQDAADAAASVGDVEDGSPGASHPRGGRPAGAEGSDTAGEAGAGAEEPQAGGDGAGTGSAPAGSGGTGDEESSGAAQAEGAAATGPAEERAESPATQDGSAPGPGHRSRAPRDQDPSEDGAKDEAMSEAERSGRAAAGASEAPAAPTGPARRRLRPLRARRSRAPLSWRRLARRCVAAASALVLVSGAAGLTWWGRHSPAPMAPAGVEAVTIAEQGARTVYNCPGRPGNTLAAADEGETTARTLITPVGRARAIDYRGEALKSEGTTSLDTGTGGVLSIEPAESQAVSAATVITSLTNGGDLRGLTAAPCLQPSAVSWIVGGSADLGASADLRLDNPGVTAVTARVTLYGSSGRLSLPSNGEVTIPAGKSQSMLLETSGSQDERIAVSIEADGGSLVPSLATESLDGETAAGVDVITPGAVPATDLTIPAVQVVEAAKQGETPEDSTGATSSEATAVRVVNPNEEPASISITMLGPEGPTPLPGAQEVEIDPGAVFDLSLRGVEPGTYGVRVTADRQVAAAARLVRSAGEHPARSGALVHDEAWIQAGAADSGPRSILAVPRGGGLTPLVALANSGPQRTVTVASLDGGWSQEVSLPPGAASTVEVPQDFSAVIITDSAAGEGLAAATVVTAEATGDAAGTLISAVPAVPDAAASAQRDILLD